LTAIPAAAQSRPESGFELGAGMSFTRDEEHTPAIGIAWLPYWREFHQGTLRWDLGAIHLRARDHSRYDNDDAVNIFHAGLRYERPGGLIGGFAIAVQHGKTDALSGDPQFISSIGWRWNRISLMFRHISNARLHGPNEGENILQLGWRF